MTDDQALGNVATDIRVFGKWSGVDVQITDMSLEVRLIQKLTILLMNSFVCCCLGLHSWCKTTKISTTFSWSLSSKTFP